MEGMMIRPHLDSNGRDLAIEHVQDVEPILDWNQAARREHQASDWGRHIARIPNVIYMRLARPRSTPGAIHRLRHVHAEFDQIVQKKLDDPEWAYLRTDRPKLQAGWSAGIS